MARSRSSRGTAGNIRVQDIVNLLSRAGWTMRQGHGDHVVLEKSGHRNIVLAEPMSKNQWTSVERVLGVQIESLFTKVRAKSKGVTAHEYRIRLQLALDLQKMGFPEAWTTKHAGLQALRNAYPVSFRPALLETLGVAGVLEKYVVHPLPREEQVVRPKRVALEHSLSIEPDRTVPVFGDDRMRPFAMPYIPKEIVSASTQDDTLSTILSLLTEVAAGRSESEAVARERMRQAAVKFRAASALIAEAIALLEIK